MRYMMHILTCYFSLNHRFLDFVILNAVAPVPGDETTETPFQFGVHRKLFRGPTHDH